MANQEHVGIFKQGVEAWNQWRKENPSVRPDLREEDLQESDFNGVNLRNANLSGANLGRADLRNVRLSGTDLSRATLIGANLSGVRLRRDNFRRATLIGANLTGANLRRADLRRANLSDADLRRADLSRAILVETNLIRAKLTGCCIFGISAWNVKLEGATQDDLVITLPNEPTITVDNLEVAQFIYLLLNNKKIRDVIDTITSKVVLILGRFTPERKTVLDALREELRKQNYLPILFDFEKPGSRNFTETVRTLAHLARFIIADLSDPSSIPQELQAIIPTLAVPVQPVLLEGKREYAMFIDFLHTYHWVLPVHYYLDQANLLTTLKEHVRFVRVVLDGKIS